ncbi:MAG TPA: aminotransferase class III-fold pyridoxal phosphate-dependent enzyme, partial [Rhizomicrobium sp.]
EELSDHPFIGDIRGLGLLAGIEFVADRATKARFPGKLNVAGRIKAELLKRGLCTRVLSDVICLAPPLICTEQQIDQIVGIVVSTLSQPFDQFTSPL